MTFYNKKLKTSLSSNILKYINSTEPIKEIPQNNNNKLFNSSKKNKNKTFRLNKPSILKNKNKNKLKLKSLSENDLFLPCQKSPNIHPKSNTINKIRPFSNRLYPYKTINVIKNFGFNSPLILNDDNIYLGNKEKRLSCIKSLSYSSNKNKKKKLKLKFDDLFQNNIKFKSPLELLVEKKENELNIKYASKPIISNQKILSNFFKKNIKYKRNNSFKDNYYFIKSKLNNITKSTEKKLCTHESGLKFDNDKYTKFRTISNNIKKRLLLSDKKLSIKKLLEQIKKEKNVMNLKRISQLKQDIEDNKILYTPKNFIKYRKDDFSYYKLNLLIKKLNCDFTYKYRFILANELDIYLEEYLRK